MALALWFSDVFCANAIHLQKGTDLGSSWSRDHSIKWQTSPPQAASSSRSHAKPRNTNRPMFRIVGHTGLCRGSWASSDPTCLDGPKSESLASDYNAFLINSFRPISYPAFWGPNTGLSRQNPQCQKTRIFIGAAAAVIAHLRSTRPREPPHGVR